MAQHLSEVEAVADGMLARLDELTATLGTVRRCALCAHSPRADAARSQVSGDAAQQQAMLAPAYSSITAGLARDFAYIDGVGVRARLGRPLPCALTRRRRNKRCRMRW